MSGNSVGRPMSNGIVLIALLDMNACTVLKPVQRDRESIHNQIEAGDRIELITVSGQRMEMTVRGLTDESIQLVGPGDQDEVVAYIDIADLQVRRTARGKTAGLVAGVTAVLLLIQLRDSSDNLSFQGAPTGL